MNPSRISIIAIALIGSILSAMLMINQNNQPTNARNDQLKAQQRAVLLATQIDEKFLVLNQSLKSLAAAPYWQSLSAVDWPNKLNSQKALYQAVGFSALGVHSLANNTLSFEKSSRPGKFLELTEPLKQLYKQQNAINLVQWYKESPALISLLPMRNIDNQISGAMIGIKYLSVKKLKHYQQISQAPVAVINDGIIKATSLDKPVNLQDYLLVEVKLPQKMDSSLWTLVLLVKAPEALSLSIIYLLVGLLLTVILILIVWKQFSATKESNKLLNQCLDVKLSLSDQITNLTNLQNTAHDHDLVDSLQAIRLRLEHSVQQQKALNLEIRKHKENSLQLKRTASDLSSERDDAIAAPRLKSEFLSRMGDEITTPMKSVISMLKLLSEYQLDAEAKQILNIAKRSTRTLVDNLNNILDFSKLDAQMLRLKPSKFSVRELIDDLASELSHFANEKELSLQASCDPDLPSEVLADKLRVRQILRNLLGNAIRFTKSGEVSLYADFVEKDENKLLRFTVKDTGVGISQEAQKGLFDSLEQASKLTNSSFAGRLRLIVSKNLSDLMGGEIGVISDIGEGSQFWFTISID